MPHGTMPAPARRPSPARTAGSPAPVQPVLASLRPLACRRDQTATETGSLLTMSRPT